MNINDKYYDHINYIYCFKDLKYQFFHRAFDYLLTKEIYDPILIILVGRLGKHKGWA